MYKNGDKEVIPILYNDQLILEKASENKVELTINNSRKESSAANTFASVGLFLIFLIAIVLILIGLILTVIINNYVDEKNIRTNR